MGANAPCAPPWLRHCLWVHTVHTVHPRVSLFLFFSVAMPGLVVLFFSLADKPFDKIYGITFSGTGLPLCHKVMMQTE